MADATRRIALTAALAAGAALALALVAAVHPGPFVFDEPLGEFLQRLPPGFGEVASLPGDWRIAVPSALAIALLAWRSGSGAIAVAAIAAEGARFVNHAWKALIERPRPGPDALAIHEVASGWSYPSGHAYTAALVFGILAILAFLRFRGAPRRVAAGTAAAAVLLTGVGRVVVGAHWPSDVLGGWLAGAATAAALVLLASRLGTRWAGAGGDPGAASHNAAPSD